MKNRIGPKNSGQFIIWLFCIKKINMRVFLAHSANIIIFYNKIIYANNALYVNLFSSHNYGFLWGFSKPSPPLW